jgi:hypothetical protein
MSTALVTTPRRALATTDAALPELSFAAMMQMGQALVGTGFLPDHIKNGPQAAAIILAGRELGMEPMRALRSLSLVKGKITEAADSQLARFKSDGGRAVFSELSDTGAVLSLTHPNGDKHTETFTIDDARKAGLLSSGMYSKFPKAMLRSRAITAALKSIGWEGGSGVYDPSELAEPTPEPARQYAAPTNPAVEVPAYTAGPDAPVARFGMTLEQAENIAVGKGEKRVRLGDTRTERLRDLEVYYAEKGDDARLAAVQIVLASRDDDAHTEALEAVEVAA